jgi:enamine deaminase RidA (YjgF/YER057c/UK114 family)
VHFEVSVRPNGEVHVETAEGLSPQTLPPPGLAGYSHMAKVNKGTTVYVSGQVPINASGNLIGEGDFEAQVEQVFSNLKLAVEAAGGTMADIVKLNLLRRSRAGSGQRAEAAPDSRSLPQCRNSAGQHVPRRGAVVAAGLAGRDRGGSGNRRLMGSWRSPHSGA